MNPNKSFTAASFLACLLILLAGVAIAADGDDDNVEIQQRHHIKLQLDEGLELIEIDDLQPGESRQFFTEDGKEIVVTRGDDGIDVSVDGEELDLPKMIRVETEKFHGGGEQKVIVRSLHGGSPGSAVWIASGEGTESQVEIEHLGGEAGHRMHWVSGDAAAIQLHRRSAAEFLQEKGALVDLSDADREAILAALKEFDSQGLERKMIFIGKGDADSEE